MASILWIRLVWYFSRSLGVKDLGHLKDSGLFTSADLVCYDNHNLPETEIISKNHFFPF